MGPELPLISLEGTWLGPSFEAGEPLGQVWKSITLNLHGWKRGEAELNVIDFWYKNW